MYEKMVTLVDTMGTDLTIVNSARVSFNKESDWDYGDKTVKTSYDWENGGDTITEKEKILKDSDVKLINYLANHGHWTPFSQCQIQLRIKMPIFVARQWFKHMVGFTRNEVSRRYVDYEPEFFIPNYWRKRPDKSKKQGSSDDLICMIDNKSISVEYQNLIDSMSDAYNSFIENGVAPEQARMLLPQSMMTEFVETGSLSAYARLYKLRIEKSAQLEIQEYANEIGKIMEKQFPNGWKALTQNQG
jgi:thymidylate synthase (FAD)